MEDYQKLYARHERSDGHYSLKSYWTSSQTVEFDNGQTLEEYKSALLSELDTKGDEIGFSLDDGELYLYSNGVTIDTESIDVNTTPNFELEDITNLSIRMSNNSVRFTWEDPEDIVFSKLPLVEWAGTKVVRKVGSAPDSVNDGTLIADSKTRNAYSSTPYYDETATAGLFYYYRFFPYDKDGNYYGKTCGVIYKPIVLEPVPIPSVSGTYTYTGESITPTFNDFDNNAMTKGGATHATNAGTYITTFTLKEGYKWSDDTTEVKSVEWSIEKAQGYINLDSYDITIEDDEDYINIISSSGTVTIYSIGDSSIINASISNDVITISKLDVGETTIILSVNEVSNYLSNTVAINVTCIEKIIEMIHLLGTYGASGYNKHYKFNDTTWVNEGATPYEFRNGSAITYNNEIHIIGGSNVYSRHSKFDGSQWSYLNTLPFNFVYGYTVIYNNELHAIGGTGSYSYDSFVHYKYNGNTWSNVSTLPYNCIRGAVVVYNNEIHILGGESNKTKHYKYNGTEWTEASTLPYDFYYGCAVVYNNKIHILGGSYNYIKHYQFDGNTWSNVGVLPYYFYYGSAIVYNDEIHIFGSAQSGNYQKHYSFDGTSWKSVSTIPYNYYGGSVVLYK